MTTVNINGYELDDERLEYLKEFRYGFRISSSNPKYCEWVNKSFKTFEINFDAEWEVESFLNFGLIRQADDVTFAEINLDKEKLKAILQQNGIPVSNVWQQLIDGYKKSHPDDWVSLKMKYVTYITTDEANKVLDQK